MQGIWPRQFNRMQEPYGGFWLTFLTKTLPARKDLMTALRPPGRDLAAWSASCRNAEGGWYRVSAFVLLKPPPRRHRLETVYRDRVRTNLGAFKHLDLTCTGDALAASWKRAHGDPDDPVQHWTIVGVSPSEVLAPTVRDKRAAVAGTPYHRLTTLPPLTSVYSPQKDPGSGARRLRRAFAFVDRQAAAPPGPPPSPATPGSTTFELVPGVAITAIGWCPPRTGPY